MPKIYFVDVTNRDGVQTSRLGLAKLQKTMINLKLLNEALGNVSSDEFAVLYFIANTISLKKEGRTRIYRELIADKLGWLNEARPEYALKKVTKITNSLVEQGYLVKEEVFISPQKSVTFYALSTQKSDKKLTPSTQKNVPLNNNEKEDCENNCTCIGCYNCGDSFAFDKTRIQRS